MFLTFITVSTAIRQDFEGGRQIYGNSDIKGVAIPESAAPYVCGFNNAQFAAVLGAEAMKGVLDLPLKLLRVTSQHQIQAPYNEATQWFDQEYIFLNLDDSKLQ